MTDCIACGEPTPYPNRLCCYCYDLGIRGISKTREFGCVILDAETFGSYARQTPLGRGIPAHVNAIVQRAKEPLR